MEKEFKGMVDWNKISIEDKIEHLKATFMVDSSGTAKAVFDLIQKYNDLREENERLKKSNEIKPLRHCSECGQLNNLGGCPDCKNDKNAIKKQ